MARSLLRLRQGVGIAVAAMLVGGVVPGAAEAAPRPAGAALEQTRTQAKLPAPASPAFQPLQRRVLSGRYIVEVLTPADRAAVLEDHPQVRPTGRFRAAVAGFAARMDAATASALRQDPRVRAVEADELFSVSATQSSPVWGLDRIDQAAAALDRTYNYPAGQSGRGVTAYVLDSGLYRRHVEFEDRARRGFDATGGGSTDDCHGHGTHVAGTIGGRRFGVAKQVTIVPVRVLRCSNYIRKAHVLAGLDYVARDHRKGRPAVVNMSLGGPASGTIDRAVARLIDEGITVVAAAGNNTRNACYVSPARIARVLTVGAVDRTDTAPYWSNYGPCLDLFAPGVDIVSAGRASRTAAASYEGTSMASPHVAGVVARLLSRTPGASPKKIAARIKRNATNRVRYAGLNTTTRLLYLRGQRPTRLRVTLSTAKTYRGDALTVQGTLRNAVSATPIGGQRVIVSSRPVGARTWERIGSRITNASGRITLTHNPARSVEYRLRHAGSATTQSDASPAATVSVDPHARTVVSAGADDAFLVAGTATTVTGTLRRTSGSPLGGKVLALYARPVATSAWTKLAQKTTNSLGRAVFSHAPVRHTEYQVRHAGSTNTLASESGRPVVDVAFAVASALDATAVLEGATVTVSGTVFPVPMAATADLLVSDDDGLSWSLVTAVPLTAGAFQSQFLAPVPGEYDYMVQMSSDATHASGTGPWHHLVVNSS